MAKADFSDRALWLDNLLDAQNKAAGIDIHRRFRRIYSEEPRRALRVIAKDRLGVTEHTNSPY